MFYATLAMETYIGAITRFNQLEGLRIEEGTAD